jgi:glutamate-1-semialdehyde 2,1-aminomutase
VDPTELATRARRVLPGGSTHAAREYQPPLYVDRTQGSHKWLVDGRELIDYTMGHGALLLGHAHPDVVSAVQRQVARGTHYGAAHPLEVEWAELICSMVPSAEEVRFTASGTEAAMLALRLARAATGRERVVKFDHHFHGWADQVSIDLDPSGRPAAAPGVAASTAALTTVVRAGDGAGLADALASRTAAALIMEPSGAHYGREMLDVEIVRHARELCAATGTLLIFDEVVTGFRVAPGGLQSILGVTPDLCVLGKVMAGGLPGGAVAGRRAVLEQLAGSIHHPGTFNANPLSAAAGITTLRLVADGAPQASADAYATRLESGWRDALSAAGVPGRVWRLSSIIHIELASPEAQSGLAGALRAEGIDLLHTSAFCSAVHTNADLDASVAAMTRALERARHFMP